jgi:hypothetical protein
MEDNWVWIEDHGWAVFPPLPLNGDVTEYPYHLKVWSDFSNLHPNYPQSEFLDWEYIMDSKQFNDLSGGKWEVYRKNVRKWPRHNENWKYTDVFDYTLSSIIVGEWLEGKIDSVQDGELIIAYVLADKNEKGIYKKLLYNEFGQLLAINIWDENWKYINYRYCIIKQAEPFLDEFVRYLFYTDPEIQSKGKLINDGGGIGNKGLEAFKDKLHPVRKREVHSWFV